jgi:hypothetical protein
LVIVGGLGDWGDFVIAAINRPISQSTNPAINHQITRSLNHQIAGREARQ